MTATCQSCSAPSPDAFICGRCATELRDNLRALAEGPYIPMANGKTKSGGKWSIERRTPGLLANLSDVVLRQTRIGSGSGHRKRGDEITAPYEPDTANGKRTRQAEAGVLLDAINSGLCAIVRDLCESRGVQCPRTDTEGVARYLAAHVAAISADESAGVWHGEITAFVRRIERVIDRPVSRKWLGTCPTWLETERRACKTDLFATEDAVEVYCRKCRCMHSCNRLKLLLFNDLEYEKVTWEKLLEANKAQADGFQVSERTLRWWRDEGKLRPRGYRRPDGREVINRHSEDDEPLYKWADVRKLRTQQGRVKIG